ncbi:hypothetical protein QA641_04440 [Bradyrhizobium sp. CB1650]|uniref:hypothetical protein n=1 Tax=Bradyrhizobium sp. CB1650 TaxID=3039153 RepID=UPI002435BBBA|nr:hypothetical protein [Bradyrhizobium sp. CB1650]WGD53189.1 hypothetical protein QA641_04440 [Bradyrhizobium sp. CB1650]
MLGKRDAWRGYTPPRSGVDGIAALVRLVDADQVDRPATGLGGAEVTPGSSILDMDRRPGVFGADKRDRLVGLARSIDRHALPNWPVCKALKNWKHGESVLVLVESTLSTSETDNVQFLERDV